MGTPNRLLNLAVSFQDEQDHILSCTVLLLSSSKWSCVLCLWISPLKQVNLAAWSLDKFSHLYLLLTNYRSGTVEREFDANARCINLFCLLVWPLTHACSLSLCWSHLVVWPTTPSRLKIYKKILEQVRAFSKEAKFTDPCLSFILPDVIWSGSVLPWCWNFLFHCLLTVALCNCFSSYCNDCRDLDLARDPGE